MFPRLTIMMLAGTSVVGPLAMAGVDLPYRNAATRELLVRELEDEDRIQRVRAATALIANGGGDRDQAVAKLASDSVSAVGRAAESSAYAARKGEIPTIAPSGWTELATKQGFQPRPVVNEASLSENHPDPRVRQAARLKKLESDPALKDDFTEALRDADYFVRQAVTAHAIKTRGANSLGTWRKLAAGDWVEGQVEAARAIGQLDSKADEPLLLPLLKSASERLRLTAIESLVRVGGDATRQILGDAILNSTGRTQERLLELAAHLKALPALPAIRRLIDDKKTARESLLFALDAVRAMADQEAKPLLLKIVKSYSPEHGYARRHAAQALGVLGGTEAVGPLHKLVAEKVVPVPMMGMAYDMDPTRIACVEALLQLNAAEVLKKMLDEPFVKESSEGLCRVLAEALTKVTGVTHDYRRYVTFPSYFIESLAPDEYPPDLAENLKKPPIFVVQ